VVLTQLFQRLLQQVVVEVGLFLLTTLLLAALVVVEVVEQPILPLLWLVLLAQQTKDLLVAQLPTALVVAVALDRLVQ
jgi:hypothetical protein